MDKELLELRKRGDKVANSIMKTLMEIDDGPAVITGLTKSLAFFIGLYAKDEADGVNPIEAINRAADLTAGMIKATAPFAHKLSKSKNPQEAAALLRAEIAGGNLGGGPVGEA